MSSLLRINDTDSCTLQLAAALKAEKLILMTDVPGVMRDKDDISTKFAELDIRDTRQVLLSSSPAKPASSVTRFLHDTAAGGVRSCKRSEFQ